MDNSPRFSMRPSRLPSLIIPTPEDWIPGHLIAVAKIPGLPVVVNNGQMLSIKGRINLDVSRIEQVTVTDTDGTIIKDEKFNYDS